MTYTDDAIIIKTRDLGEADKIVILIGKRHGRIEAIAKGARKPTSRKSSHIDLGVEAKFTFVKTKGLDILTEVSPIELFEEIKNSLQKSAALYYCFDLTDRMFSEVGQGEEIFADLIEFLSILSLEENAIKLVHLFEIQILQKSGFFQQLEKTKNLSTRQKRMFKIINYVQENSLTNSTKLKLDSEDLAFLENYLYNQIIDVIEKDLKTYKFLKQVT